MKNDKYELIGKLFLVLIIVLVSYYLGAENKTSYFNDAFEGSTISNCDGSGCYLNLSGIKLDSEYIPCEDGQTCESRTLTQEEQAEEKRLQDFLKNIPQTNNAASPYAS